MPKLLCKLINASTNINGINFVATPAGLLSQEVSDKQAEFFAKIPGYEVLRPQGAPVAQAEAAAAHVGDPVPAEPVPAEPVPAEPVPAAKPAKPAKSAKPAKA